jgi:hypothetical protein
VDVDVDVDTSRRDVILSWIEEYVASVPRLDRLPYGDRLTPVAGLLRDLAAAAEKAGPAALLASADNRAWRLVDTPLIPGAVPRATGTGPA